MENEEEPLHLQQQPQQSSKSPALLCALVISILLLCGLAGFTIYYVIKYPTSSNSSSSKNTCTSSECVLLGATMIGSMNTSVDPCDDFYEYACGNWDAANSWRVIDVYQYQQFTATDEFLRNNFLDELFYDTDQELLSGKSVQNALTMYKTCHSSVATEDDLYSHELMAEFIKIVNFTITSDDWTNPEIAGFHSALAWLNLRNWNNIFQMNSWLFQTSRKHSIELSQNLKFWSNYKTNNLSHVISAKFEPLFTKIFGLTANESAIASKEVIALGNEILAISDEYLKYILIRDSSQIMFKTWDQFDATFTELGSDAGPMNMKRIVYQTFNDTNVDYFLYYDQDIAWFDALSPIIQKYKPSTLQMFLFTNVLLYVFNYEQTWDADATKSARNFCYETTRDELPFVFGYITGNILYNDDKQQAVLELASMIKTHGLEKLISDSKWLENESKEELLLKAKKMKLYIGIPPKILKSEEVDKHYADVAEFDATSWLTNMAIMADWRAEQTLLSFDGIISNITAPWPDTFTNPSEFDSWLTGINAFYVNDNWFTIPIPISQNPFFNDKLPSFANFGGIGSISGHEMGHGFDPNGFNYDWNGSKIEGSIVTESDLEEYNAKKECYIDQYNGIQIGVDANGDPIFVDGRYLATLTHAPNYARVIGTLQNSNEFADAFQCETGSRMNPKDKCTLW